MKNLFSNIVKMLKPETETEARERFLSKATNAVEVEHLQRQWDRMTPSMSSMNSWHQSNHS